ncbi:symmetrical bis(5'-nucleosyl)-tetraphosphatase [Janthinobacterium fluminis]|uniref:Bis(5'-nucleosyl)-tetraphosphatase, symmetrical n=1 Tax=Janthinobacterium fluminis TaxID=2987524 RepID=A0ABT5K1B0_9BURK|nr:symmetrical bis(5'-nucleosyl)-tetraphosphatase [Janthinobacterium fluminis]MDC8758768.1 symmetrical bis(5'-nucleosyl)-tetraphosphatase [Janthinobacterium fluminis]
MKTYVIGDLQGCHAQTVELLERIGQSCAGPHTLLFAGDLVNRGPQSLATLRLVHGLARRGQADSVLGNHDLHLLAVAAGIRPPHAADTLDEILAAPDRDALLDWLRRRPLALLRDGHLLVHAGLLPQWSAQQAVALAGEVESALRGPAWKDFLLDMYGNAPAAWDEGLRGAARLRCIVNALTRLRFCTADGVMDFKMKESGSAPPGSGLLPWFDVPGRRSAGDKVVFGHWSALGLLRRPALIGLDSGCVWGGSLSAVCLDDGSLLQVACPGYRRPGAAAP